MFACLICGLREAVGYPPGWCAVCTIGEIERKRRCRVKTNKAIKSGELKRAPCDVCGDVEVVGHHLNYDDHLAIRWLCVRHHRQVHDAEKRARSGPFLTSRASRLNRPDLAVDDV